MSYAPLQLGTLAIGLIELWSIPVENEEMQGGHPEPFLFKKSQDAHNVLPGKSIHGAAALENTVENMAESLKHSTATNVQFILHCKPWSYLTTTQD